MVSTYSSLHNHSYFSPLDGFGSPREMLDRAKAMGLKGLAITEHGNAYSWCYFDKIKHEYPDIKMIYGVEFYECFDMSVQDPSSKYFHLIALAKNEKGRKALNKLITKSNFEGFYFKPRVDLKTIAPYADDLIVTSACLASKIAREDDYELCLDYVCEYKKIFKHFYLEIQSHKHPDQEKYNKKIIQLSRDTNTPFIITTDSHAATESDLYYQSRHVQIAHDSETLTEIYEGCYIQDVKTIHNILDSQIGYESVEIGLANTNLLADLIEEVHMPFQKPQLPTYPLPEGFDSDYMYLCHLIKVGWSKRNFENNLNINIEVYKKRIEYELEIINTMGFDGYFIIVWDFINWAKDNGVTVGVGRGSGAGSLICYTIGVTDLDPIKYGLIFERFLNPERISMPDLDIDLGDRGKVIDYLMDKYGENNVCQIINFTYITPVVAIKDVGKVLGFTYREMDKLSKKFTYDTFSECLESNKELALNERYSELFDIAGKLSGRLKTVSCHAGGVGIVDTDISDYMPMKLGSKGEHVIQVDKRIIEEIGIIKFDLLGVQTLNLLKEVEDDLCLDEYELNINNPKFECDEKAFQLLNNSTTNGVFQLESFGMKDLLQRMNVKDMNDLSAVLALYRPDSMGALEEYIECSKDDSKVNYLHEDMKPILKETYGLLIYQEELLDIVKQFGGRSYGGADLFRKAIGKKNIQLVKEESAKLYQEIINTGYDKRIAKTISDDLANKGGYLFNKSHSFSYAVLALQTAYLKAHYPLYFFKALFNINKDKAGMINKYILDSKEFNITVCPPNINKSELNFSIDDDKILFGLSAINGIGETFANAIIKERETNGKFTSLSNFINRVNPKKSQIIMLIKSGAFPTKNKHKSLIIYLKGLYKPTAYTEPSKLPPYKELLLKWDIDCEQYRIGTKKYDFDKDKMLSNYREKKYQTYLSNEQNRFQKYIDENNKYLANERFWEFEALQIFINDNPFDEAYKYMSKTFEEVADGSLCTIVGVIAKVQKKKDKNKKQFAYVNIYSSFGLVEAIVWHSKLKEYEDLIAKGNKIAMLCKKDSIEKVICEDIKPYEDWLNHFKKERRIK